MINMICTFPDGIIIAGNLIVLVIGLILDRIDKNKEIDTYRDSLNNIKQRSEEEETPYYETSTYKINT